MPLPDPHPDPPPAAPDAAAQSTASHHHPVHPAHPAHPVPASAAPLVADEQNSAIHIAPGQEFTLQKSNSGSIGYSWALADAGDPQIVQLLNTANSADAPRPPGPPIVGAPSQLTWTFRAVAAGQTQLRFAFSQRTGLGMAVPGPETYTVR